MLDSGRGGWADRQLMSEARECLRRWQLVSRLCTEEASCCAYFPTECRHMGFLPPTRGRLGRRIRRQARQCRRQDRIAGGCAGGWSGGSLHVRRAVHGVSRIFWTRNCLARGLDRPFCMDEDPIRNLGRSRGRIELCAVGRVVGWQRARRLPRRLRGSAAQINRGGV